jgi:hypothetical protein
MVQNTTCFTGEEKNLNCYYYCRNLHAVLSYCPSSMSTSPDDLEETVFRPVEQLKIENDSIVAALRARSHVTTDLLFIDRICTWVYWTAEQSRKWPSRAPKK